MKAILRKLCSFIVGLLLPALVFSQSVYTHISHERIYDFLDELAGEKVITLNTVVKPYTRTYIYEKLIEAESHKDKLNNRQQQELEHYLDCYTFGNRPGYLPSKSWINLFKKSRHLSTSVNHMAFFYSDSLFSCSLRPILGLNYFRNGSGDYVHTYGGLEAFGSVTKYVSFYASLRDNTVSEKLAMPTYFVQDMAGIYKGSVREGGSDFSEMRGGVMLSWDFLQVGVVKDHIEWGNNYNGAIIQSGRAPSFPMLKLHICPVKWFDFNYFHAWLVSDVVDSSLTYLMPGGLHRETFRNKYMASNMFTVTPLKGLNLSFGNSIIYSDQNVNPAYLIPVFFYKSVDHSLTSNKVVNHNSQMFFDLSVRMLRHTHFFLTVFIDEFSTKRISDPDEHNFYAYKLGGRVSNWPVRNLSFTGEYFRSVPAVYQHYGPTFTYESNSYNMGATLRDNSEEIFLSLDFKPFQRFFVRYAYTDARHGNDYGYVYGNDVTSLPILQDNTWTRLSHSLLCSYEIFTNCHLSLEYRHSDTQGYEVDGQTAEYYLDRFTPEFFQGKKNTVMVRVNVGF